MEEPLALVRTFKGSSLEARSFMHRLVDLGTAFLPGAASNGLLETAHDPPPPWERRHAKWWLLTLILPDDTAAAVDMLLINLSMYVIQAGRTAQAK